MQLGIGDPAIRMLNKEFVGAPLRRERLIFGSAL
jgi:hypothetical protein